MILFCIFQVIDHAALKPVRQTDFGYEVGAICVTSHWLVVTQSIYLKALPKFTVSLTSLADSPANLAGSPWYKPICGSLKMRDSARAVG